MRIFNFIIIIQFVAVLSLSAQTKDSLKQVIELDSVSNEMQETSEFDRKLNQISKQVTGVSILPEKEKENKAPSILEVISVYKVFWSIVFFLSGWLTIRVISNVLEAFAERSTNYRITIKSYLPVVKILGWILIIFIIVSAILRPPLATLLAFSASIGVAVGFASQDILKNIFGGIMILFDRPFKAGDKIQIGDIYGEVIEVGLRSTRIVTPDDNLVSIPNSEIMNSPVSNANAGEANCQVAAEIFLPINVDTSHVREIAIQAAQVSRYVYLNKPITILFFNEYKDKEPVFKMKIKAYVLDIRDEFKFKSEMTEITIKQLLKEKIIKI